MINLVLAVVSSVLISIFMRVGSDKVKSNISLLAMNYVTNVTYVQIFRQLGLVIGVAGGIFILKERAAAPKIAGVTLILLGLAISVL